MSSKGAFETNSDKAVTGGEVEQERNSVTVATTNGELDLEVIPTSI